MGGISATALKIIGMIAMTIDHIGYFLFPQIEAFRIIGRIAYPIFAYMIAEGCRYTRNKVKYLLSVLGVGCGCSAVSYITEASLYQSILITFACSIALIFALEKAISGSRHLEKVLFGLSAILLTGLYFCLFRIHIIPGLETDYGFYGILTPALIRFGRNKSEKLLALTVGLCLISIGGMPSQLFSLAAVGILAFYNGKRGKARYEMAFLRILSASYCCAVCNFAACAWMIREDEYNNRDAGMAQPSRHFLSQTKSRPCVSRSAFGYAILLSLMVNWLFLCAAAFL